MPPSTTPGSSVPRYSSLAAPTWPLPTRTEARLSQVTCHPLPAGEVLRGFLVRFCCACQVARPLCGSDQKFPSHRDFYFQASVESVTLLGAGYNYDSNLIASSMGLSPIGLTSSPSSSHASHSKFFRPE